MPVLIDRTGETRKNKYGNEMKIIEYDNNKRIIVEFDDGSRLRTKYSDFVAGTARINKRKGRKKLGRIGEIGTNIHGTKMKILEYENTDDILVEFQDKNRYKIKTNYKHFLSGCVQNPYDRTVHGVGFLGEGKYLSRVGKEKLNKDYSVWASMIQRCYDPKYHAKEPSYIGCTVCEDWHNFQNFAKWHEENFYQIKNCKIQLDKDILYKNNKIYSPGTCIFVPQKINLLFISKESRFFNTPVGVTYDKQRKKFKPQCWDISGKMKYLGRFDTPEEAFAVYKREKEKTVKEVAYIYKNEIPVKLYDALINYKIEIGD